MVEERAHRFRPSALALGLVFLGVCSCGGSSEERGSGARGGAGASDSGAAGDAGLGGASQGGGTGGTGGTASTGGTAPTGAAGGGSAATGGDAGTSGNAGASGRGGAGGDAGAGNGGTGGSAGAGGGASGAGARGGNGGSSGAGGSGGAGAVSYATCQFGSGIARIVVAKRDAARDRCVVLVMNQPGSDTLGLTLPMSWGVESAFFSTPATVDCLIRFPPAGATSAENGTGTVTRATGFIVDVDVTLTFPGNVMENLEAIGLDASRGCPF